MQEQGSTRLIAEPSTDDHIVLAQATTGQAETQPLVTDQAPRELVPQGALADTEQAPIARERIEIPDDFQVPGAGVRLTVLVPSGADVALLDPQFDPRVSNYAVDGNDLIITLSTGGVLILEDFFLAGAVPATLTLLDGPAVASTDLLLRAETFAAQEQAAATAEPAAGEEQEPGTTGGGADFRVYDPGQLGPGLAHLGPLGPTALDREVDFFTAELDSDRIDDDTPISPPPVSPPPPPVSPPPVSPPPVSPPPVSPPPVSPPPVSPPPVSPPPVSPPPVSPPPVSPPPVSPPPVSPPPVSPPPAGEAPVLSLRAEVDAIIAEQSIGFNPATTPRLPIRGDGQTIADADINGIDQRNLCLDADREVFVRFVDETSISIDSLFVHEVGEDGSIINIRPVFPFTNKPGEPFRPADLEPGTEVSLGIYEAGTKINFFLLNDGGRQNDPDLFTTGRLELRNPDTGEVARNTDEVPPILVHIAEDGTETVMRVHMLFGTDDSQHTPNHNDLNPDREGHVVSGWDEWSGSLIFGFEDDVRANKDNDFNDDVYAVRFGSVTEKFVFLVGQEAAAGLGATITDADSSIMRSARINLRQHFDGDSLVLPASALEGTDIRIVRQSDDEIQIHGRDSIANYEKVIGAITLEISQDDPVAGTRTIDARVLDSDGNVSNTAVVSVDLADRLIAGDAGNNELEGVSRSEVVDPAEGDDALSGRGGFDLLDGRSGNDFIDGGAAIDVLRGGNGNDILNGGPARDRLFGGDGADEFRVTGLSDGIDRISDFDAAEGDVLGLHLLFEDAGVDVGGVDVRRFVRFRELDADEDGSRDDVQVQVDLDGSGSAHRFVTVFELINPLGIDGSTDPLAVTTLNPDNNVS